MNINRLRGRIVEKGMRVVDIANVIGISKSSLYRKMHNPELLTIGDAIKLKSILDLNNEEATDIFLN